MVGVRGVVVGVAVVVGYIASNVRGVKLFEITIIRAGGLLPEGLNKANIPR